MEAIAVAASILTIAAFSETLIRTSQTAYDAVLAKHDFGKDIKFFADSFRGAGDAFSDAQKSLEGLSQEVRGSDVGVYLQCTSLPQLQDSILYLDEQCKGLDPLFERIRDHDGIVGFRMRLKWLYKDKDRCTDLMQKTQFLQATVTMMLLNFLIKQNKLDAATSRDLASRIRLEKEFESYNRRLQRLEERYKQLREDIGLGHSSDSREATTPQQESMDCILKLSSNMRKYGGVPEVPHMFSPTSSQSRTSSESTSRSTSRSTPTSSSEKVEGPILRLRKEERTPLSPRQPRCSLRPSRPETNTSVFAEPGLSFGSRPGFPTPIDLSVSPTSDFTESINLSGHLNPKIQSNIISSATVRRHGMKIFPLEDGDSRIVTFIDGSEARFLGKTRHVYVRAMNADRMSINCVRMRFLVYFSRHDGFALGSLFIQRHRGA